ncbi:hypothetical protein G6F42_013581 [Rhizopus arrhizus]|nr:hypothetical protein G6F42_013581 [Rhizopus arrhizus]
MMALEDFDLHPSADALSEDLSQEGNVLDEDELMADLGGGDSSVLSAFVPSESLDVNHGWSSVIHALESSRETVTAKECHDALSAIIVGNKKAIVELQSYQDVVKPKAISERGRTVRGENLALNRRDLPKFQLAPSAVKAFPNEEVFESVDHYLRTVESILNSSSLDLEAQWAKLLPLCMPNGNRAWVDKTLLKCGSWAEAKQVFSRRFGSAVITRYNTDLGFTMTMSSLESIMDYSCRFQQAVYNPGLQLDDPRTADRFMASLILPVQTAYRTLESQVDSSEAGEPLKITFTGMKLACIRYHHVTDHFFGNCRAQRPDAVWNQRKKAAKLISAHTSPPNQPKPMGKAAAANTSIIPAKANQNRNGNDKDASIFPDCISDSSKNMPIDSTPAKKGQILFQHLVTLARRLT